MHCRAHQLEPPSILWHPFLDFTQLFKLTYLTFSTSCGIMICQLGCKSVPLALLVVGASFAAHMAAAHAFSLAKYFDRG